MKLEIKIILLFVAFVLIANPFMMNAKTLNKGDANYKDPLIALILSILIPGLGHMYLGQTTKGLIYLAIYIGVWVLASVLLYSTLGVSFFIAPLVAFVWAVWVALDAMKVAKRYNDRGGKLTMSDAYIHSAVTVN